MTDLHHSVPINTSPTKVFAAIATQTGNQGWWTKDTVMDPKIGGKAEFGFEQRGMVFRTTLEWTIEPTPDGSLLHFTHRGWRGLTPFCASCNSMWGNLLFRLKAYAETGKANPQWTE
jgi:hypothetical protein